jgi:hypothetical protein
VPGGVARVHKKAALISREREREQKTWDGVISRGVFTTVCAKQEAATKKKIKR